MMIISINPIHSIMWVLIIVANSAGILITINQEFLAFIIIIIYIGAITILFLFVIMMIDETSLHFISTIKNYMPSVLLLSINSLLITNHLFNKYKTINYSYGNNNITNNDNNIEIISKLIYNDYIFCFLIIAIILLIGLLASISITLKNKSIIDQ